jgi:hypothetical protein
MSARHTASSPAASNSVTSGLYDLLGHNRGYESERLVARFAVVLRERMVTW